ncbi:lysozyme inhibitor LprI family protein [Nitrospirillum sp. BR 11752]|uniref:lysozyme inhibitor LprI family protein n=1 Tax=Nitrospirillum sp. BR 11752 TaxID=3104293 RepID=UPI002EAF2927|nr:lysozyme inhibitor LprI family protein [Nitrospirillum sp. BR 11752]
MTRLPILSAAALFLSGIAQAATSGPSFDCAAAKTSTERAICADPKLAAQDREVARLYRQVLTQAGPDVAALAGEQRRWLATRDHLCQGPAKPTSPLTVGWSTEAECLSQTMILRQAALTALSEGEDNPSLCHRASTTLTLARTADDAPLQIPLDRQMIAAGLVFPAPEEKLSPAWRHRLPATAVQRRGDAIAIIPFGASHVAVTATGGTANCVSVTAFPLDANGKAGPALPRPENRPQPYCWTETVGFGTDGSGRPLFFTQNADSVRSEAGPERSTLFIRLAGKSRWGDSCNIEVTYQAAFRLGEGSCTASAPVCQALREAAPGWAATVGASPWAKAGPFHPAGGPAYPALSNLTPQEMDGAGPEGTYDVPDFPGWHYRGFLAFEMSSPLMTWQSQDGPLTVRVAPGTLGWRVGAMILGVWRQQGDSLIPVAGYVIDRVRIGHPSIKTVSAVQAD